jgi:hypothetical protein
MTIIYLYLIGEHILSMPLTGAASVHNTKDVIILKHNSVSVYGGEFLQHHTLTHIHTYIFILYYLSL